MNVIVTMNGVNSVLHTDEAVIRTRAFTTTKKCFLFGKKFYRDGLPMNIVIHSNAIIVEEEDCIEELESSPLPLHGKVKSHIEEDYEEIIWS